MTCEHLVKHTVTYATILENVTSAGQLAVDLSLKATRQEGGMYEDIGVVLRCPPGFDLSWSKRMTTSHERQDLLTNTRYDCVYFAPRG